MSERLKGRAAIVTGGAVGIGAGVVRRFVEEGASVLIADVQTEKGETLAATLGDRARFVRTDVTREEDIAAVVDMAVTAFGRLDIMINNAGIVGAEGPLLDTPIDAWNYTIDVDLRGVFLGVKHAGRAMVARKSGAIVNTASAAGILGGLGPAVYTTAKHGVIGLTKAAAAELAPHGVRVNAIAPGGTVTEMAASSLGDINDEAAVVSFLVAQSPFGRAMMPADIADAALFLSCDESRFITGQTLAVDSGMTTASGPPTHASQPTGLRREAGRFE